MCKACGNYPDCPHSNWDNGRRRCPHGCGVDCQRNVEHQLAVGRRLEKRLKNLTADDWHWLAGTGRYSQD